MMRGVLVLLLGILFTSATGGATVEATKVARSSHRKLLQAAQAPDPFILSPLVPINWFIFADAPTYRVRQPDSEGPSPKQKADFFLFAAQRFPPQTSSTWATP